MNKYVLINMFYGRLPDIFQLTLNQYGFNSNNIDFILVVNDIMRMQEFAIPKNVFILEMSPTFISDIENFTNVKINLNKPTELCGLKPLYGTILKSYINKYEYWGWIDHDVIMSNLTDYFNKIDKNYKAISIKKYFQSGIVDLVKNCDEINDFWKTNFFTYYKTHNFLYGYDERIDGFLKNININNSDIYFGSQYHDHTDYVIEGERGKIKVKIEDGIIYNNDMMVNCYIADRLFKRMHSTEFEHKIFDNSLIIEYCCTINKQYNITEHFIDGHINGIKI